jgi:hypothetical protein
MNDDELRMLIRAAIQKHAGSGPMVDESPRPPQPPVLSISFGQYRLERNDGDTSCLIEPAVQCNHCGFCKCHGH